MPELPEVETIKNVLRPHIVGRRITAVSVRNDSVVAYPSKDEFTQSLRGQVFTDFTRRGKFLTFGFQSGDTLTLHLRMTGCLTLAPLGAPYKKHTHLILSLDDGNEIQYEDTRRFGRFWYLTSGSPDISGKTKLGLEPFSCELTLDYIKSHFASKKTVKELLLDQSIVAGIGNIYSDEICFFTGIRPDRAGNSLTVDELQRLTSAIPTRLGYFIDKNKISFEDYSQTQGKEYHNTPYLQVYGKSGAPCPNCSTPLCRTQLGGRSSVFCPNCQK